jgi:ABC-type multidrug transport system fused ATPase/permease subunit
MLVVFVVGQGWANRGIRRAFVYYITLNDRRLGALRELLYNLKSVKALACESVFRHFISRVRDEQIAALRLWLSITFSYFIAVNHTIPALTATAAFLAYYLSGHELTPAIVFPSLAYFGMLHQPVSQTSMAISRQFSILPCLFRLKNLITAEETTALPLLPAEDSPAAIQFADASFLYPGCSSGILRVGSLRIPRGQFTAIVGPTGSGKSSFLKAILGEMTRNSGTCSVHGSVSYAAQDPWIMSGTLRDNVVFVSKYDLSRYNEAISMCGLDYDFRSFPSADQVQVGEAGSNLSGGQRARISLARSLYAGSDILLLDDPLSAVDGNVRELLFETIRSSKRTVIMGNPSRVIAIVPSS